eukprot:CAMPEP_0179445240 /NCGR_PEP_ID=MMETSP0799-20121207/28693_1 /TAXON_ID=46947 /ORGANISM="Geminigera cryophila, Strain CCMP2564" /LENGTH=316 /DNA_ID=CAMNT_0021233099 /DNA_START=54 /DNA_END=1004 /DNA_ORIENTATION=+
MSKEDMQERARAGDEERELERECNAMRGNGSMQNGSMRHSDGERERERDTTRGTHSTGEGNSYGGSRGKSSNTQNGDGEGGRDVVGEKHSNRVGSHYGGSRGMSSHAKNGDREEENDDMAEKHSTSGGSSYSSDREMSRNGEREGAIDDMRERERERHSTRLGSSHCSNYGNSPCSSYGSSERIPSNTSSLYYQNSSSHHMSSASSSQMKSSERAPLERQRARIRDGGGLEQQDQENQWLESIVEYLKAQAVLHGEIAPVRLTQIASNKCVPRPEGVKEKLVKLLKNKGLSVGLHLTGKGSELALSLMVVNGGDER